MSEKTDESKKLNNIMKVKTKKVKSMIQIILAIIFIVLFVLFLLPFIGAGIINAGNAAGLIVCAFLAVICIFHRSFGEFINRLRENTAGRIAVSLCGGFVVICLAAAVVMSIFMIRAATDKPVGNTTVVVLGCQVRGTSPSLMLRRRLDTAYEYLAEHDEICVVVSGGQGGDEEISEAECMYRYLVSKGISEERIYIEDNSANTQENIRFSRKIIESEGLPSDITIVTDGFHQLRADIFAKREGIRSYNISSGTPMWLLPTYWVREWFGILYYSIF